MTRMVLNTTIGDRYVHGVLDSDIHPLGRIRAQYNLSYQRLARMIAARARELGVKNMAAERQKIWRWEHRNVVPDAVSQTALASLLGVSEDSITAHPWPGWLPVVDSEPCADLIKRLSTQLDIAMGTLDSLTARPGVVSDIARDALRVIASYARRDCPSPGS
ncbi:hypothetical protein [Frankia sp. Cj5]|uniref:hypothetical protein n=1 Tax=Frankia sp. Cj5 TaxID=2880978 RepID=UPI00351CDCAA